MSKMYHSRRCIDKQYGERGQRLLKSASQHLSHIHSSLATKLCSKKSRLFTCQIFGLLVNTLAADEKYPVLNRDNLTIPIQMQLSQKKKTFSQFFAAFLKSRLNFEYFEKKDEPHSFCISEITNSENVVWQMSKKSRFRAPFDKQLGKRAQALLKSASQTLYQIHWPLPNKMSWKKSLLLTSKIFGLLVNTLASNEKYPVLNRENWTIPIQMQLS